MRYEFADVILDTDARQLLRAGAEVHVSPKAFELLEILIAERPRAIPKRELYDRLWPDTFVVEANLPVVVGEARAAIGDEAHVLIRTVHRFGYSFAAEVRVASDRAQAPSDTASDTVHLLVHGEKQYRLRSGENVVGREPAAEVHVASSNVSRRHAILTIRGPEATLTDLGSKNGTWVDTVPVSSPVTLVDGAVVRFGGVEMVYRRMSEGERTETLLD